MTNPITGKSKTQWALQILPSAAIGALAYTYLPRFPEVLAGAYPQARQIGLSLAAAAAPAYIIGSEISERNLRKDLTSLSKKAAAAQSTADEAEKKADTAGNNNLQQELTQLQERFNALPTSASLDGLKQELNTAIAKVQTAQASFETDSSVQRTGLSSGLEKESAARLALEQNLKARIGAEVEARRQMLNGAAAEVKFMINETAKSAHTAVHLLAEKIYQERQKSSLLAMALEELAAVVFDPQNQSIASNKSESPGHVDALRTIAENVEVSLNKTKSGWQALSSTLKNVSEELKTISADTTDRFNEVKPLAQKASASCDKLDKQLRDGDEMSFGVAADASLVVSQLEAVVTKLGDFAGKLKGVYQQLTGQVETAKGHQEALKTALATNADKILQAPSDAKGRLTKEASALLTKLSNDYTIASDDLSKKTPLSINTLITELRAVAMNQDRVPSGGKSVQFTVDNLERRLKSSDASAKAQEFLKQTDLFVLAYNIISKEIAALSKTHGLLTWNEESRSVENDKKELIGARDLIKTIRNSTAVLDANSPNSKTSRTRDVRYVKSLLATQAVQKRRTRSDQGGVQLNFDSQSLSNAPQSNTTEGPVTRSGRRRRRVKRS